MASVGLAGVRRWRPLGSVGELVSGSSSGEGGGVPWLWKRTSPLGMLGSEGVGSGVAGDAGGAVGACGGAAGVCAEVARVARRRVRASLDVRCRMGLRDVVGLYGRAGARCASEKQVPRRSLGMERKKSKCKCNGNGNGNGNGKCNNNSKCGDSSLRSE
jgi:hypothetical protein